jgi:hypothetical protein
VEDVCAITLALKPLGVGMCLGKIALVDDLFPNSFLNSFLRGVHVQDSNSVWLEMYVPLVNILLERNTKFRLRMAQYTHVLVDEVQVGLMHLLFPSVARVVGQRHVQCGTQESKDMRNL